MPEPHTKRGRFFVPGSDEFDDSGLDFLPASWKRKKALRPNASEDDVSAASQEKVVHDAAARRGTLKRLKTGSSNASQDPAQLPAQAAATSSMCAVGRGPAQRRVERASQLAACKTRSVPGADRHVFKRILRAQWSLALASGMKFVETQRYQQQHGTNALKFSFSGALVVFASCGRPDAVVCGVAVMAGPAQLRLAVDRRQDILRFVDPSLQEPVLAHLAVGKSFDYAEIALVYDLRAAELTWANLADRLSFVLPQQNQGFPCLGNEALGRALTQMCESLGAPVRLPMRTP